MKSANLTASGSALRRAGQLSIFLLVVTGAAFAAEARLFHAQGEMAGEVTTSTAILQSRLTATDALRDGDVPGVRGWARFEVAESPDFRAPRVTDWIEAVPEKDFIVRSRIEGLAPGRTHFYRLMFGATRERPQTGPARRFKTLPAPDQPAPVRFVVGNCMNYAFFFDGPKGDGKGARANPDDRRLGYPSMETIQRLQPDFFVGAGDNVYYDHPAKTAAKTLPELRRKWHEQFVLPRVVALVGDVATFWIKDDHDYRYNDSDPSGTKAPSHELGIATFREQMPIIHPENPSAVTYRTYRCGRWLQIWMPEGRDYRSPNKLPDGPGKSLWGAEQKAWLQRTLQASDATYKILVSPTPLVGPDDAYKKDNHVNHEGFRFEGEGFLDWVRQSGLKNFYIITGDRHWHYHSRHPFGTEEFACGALNTENARLGRNPGDQESTDPTALVKQFYTDAKPTGGYILVEVQSPAGGRPPALRFSIQDETGRELYAHTKTPAP
jgi:alkaline phosphatase/alkaline phosphatase D